MLLMRLKVSLYACFFVCLVGTVAAQPIPEATLAVPTETLLGEDLANFTVTFDNTGDAPGYGPFIDMVFPVNGMDGNAGADTPDGVTFNSATFLGSPVDSTELFFPDDGGGLGCVDHPFAVDASHTPFQVCGTTGDSLVVLRLPFGSIVPTQPAIVVSVSASLSDLADLGMPLAIAARAGFQFGLDPLDNPCCDLVIQNPDDIDSSLWPSASTTPTLVILSKTYLSPDALAEEDEVTIGGAFTHQFEIVVDIADGQTLTNLDVTDSLASIVQFISVDATLDHGASVGTTAVSTPSTVTPGGILTRRFASISGTNSAADALMRFSFLIPETDGIGNPVIPPGNCGPTLFDNNGSTIGDWTPLDGRDTGTPGNAVADPPGPETTIAVKTLPLQKTVAVEVDGGAPGASPADVLQYTLEFQVSDVMAFTDLVVTDITSDGQRFDTIFAPTIEVTEHGVSAGVVAFDGANYDVIDHYSTAPVPVLPIDGTQEFVFRVTDEMLSQALDLDLQGSCVQDGGTGPSGPDCSLFDAGQTKVRIIFRTIIQDVFTDDFPSGDASVDHGDRLNNSVTVAGDLLDPIDLTAAGAVCSDGSSAGVVIVGGAVSKELYAINGSTILPIPLEIMPGDTVSYRLGYQLPSSDFEDLLLVDFLPLPILEATEVTVFDAGQVDALDDLTIPVGGHAKLGPLDTFFALSGINPALSSDASANAVSFDYGIFDDPTNSATVVDLIFTVTVNDEPFADGLFLVNQVHASEGSTNTGGSSSDAIVPIVLREPFLSVRKGACGTDNPDEAFDPALAGAACPGSVNSNDLDGDATLADSDVSGVDVGDLMSFVISIENQGGSGAFDITIHDVLPPGFCLPGCAIADPFCVAGAGGLNFAVVRGDGFVPIWVAQGTYGDDRDLFFNGLMLDDSGGQPLCQPHDPVAGSNTLTITYDLEICDPTLVPGTLLANQGGVSGYSGTDGGPSHVDPGNPSDFTDSADTILADPLLTKTLLGTEIIDAVNAANEVVIGEYATYQLSLRVPESTMPALQLVDVLDAGLAFVDVISVALSPGLATANTVGTGANPANVVIGANGQSLQFNFGDTVNSNRVNTVDEFISIVYRVVTLNILGNQAGTPLGNSASASWTGGSIAPVFAPDVTVIEPAIAIDKSASPTNADAGDTITYSINVTSPSNPLAADARDVVVNDVIPVGMTYVAGSLGTGTCATAPTSLNDGAAPTLVVNWLLFPPGGSCQITYQATVDITVNPAQVIPNTATDQWTSLPGGPGQRSIHSTDSTERDGTGGVNDYAGSDPANVAVNNVVPAKTVVATSEASTTGSNVAVGEIVRYRLVVELPETTSPNLQLQDRLPTGLQFLNDGTAMLALISNQGPIQSTDATGDTLGLGLGNGPFGTAPWVNGNDPSVVTPTFVLPTANIGSNNSVTADPDVYNPGGDPYFKLGDLVNPDSDADAEYIVVEFNALVLNNSDIYDGRTRTNRFRVYVGGAQLAQSGGINVTVREPAVTDFDKSVNPTTGDAGDVVTYTIGWSNSGNATAFNTQLVDVISAGLILNIASVNISPAGGTSGITDNTAGNTVNILIDMIPVGGSVIVSYTATIETTVTPDQVLSNTGDLTWTSLPGTNGTIGNATGSDTPGGSGSGTGERNGSGTGENDYIASDSADVTIGSPQLSKAVVATSEVSTGNAEHTAGIDDLTIGETVTFEIRTTLPEGTTPQVILTDSLPANATGVMEYISASVISVGANLAPATANPIPAVSDANLADGINDTVAMDFGQVVNTPDGVTDAGDEIVIQVVARLKDVANNSDGNLLTNSVLLQYGSGLQASATADVEVVEPSLGITKTAAPTTGDAGDTITFTITVDHLLASTAEAFDLVITDAIPVDMTYAGNVLTISGAAPTVDSSGDPTISFSWDDLAQAAGPLTFTFDVTLDASVQPEQVIVNTAALTYDTLPADDDTEERDHSGSDAASVTITAPGLTKVVASTSVAQTGNGADTEPNLTIGEQATFEITVTVPEGTLTTAQIVDDLPTAPGLLEVVSSQITAMDADMVSSTGLAVGSAGVASDPNADTRNERVLFDFGTLTNGVGGTNEITVEVVAVVPDIALNQGGLDGLTNTATASSGGGTPVLATAAVDIVEPELEITKVVINPVSPFGDAGDVITYRMTVAHTAASSADAFDVSIDDLLPAGETYVGGSLTTISGPAPTEDVSGLPGLVVYDWSTIALADGSSVFEYQVTLNADVHPAQTYTNTATLGWDSLPTGAPGDGGPNDRAGTDSDSADITINAPSLVKITGVTSLGDTGQAEYNATQEDLAIGETVSYRITTTVPEGVTQTAVITDALQADALGVLEAIGASVVSLGANISTTLPGTPAFADNNLGDGLDDTVSFNFGDITNTADGTIDDDDRIVIEVTARVVDVPENTDADDLVNLASLTYATGAPVDDTANIDVVEPVMGIAKNMSAPWDGLVTLNIFLSNSGTAPAYDVNVTDLLPASMWDTTTIAPLAIPSGFNFGVSGVPGDATVTISSDGGSSPPASSVEPGETVVFQFTAALAGGANPPVNPILNTAVNDEASSLPGVDSSERDQPDVQADAQLQLPSIELDKSWAMAPGGDLDGSGTPSPGDILRYSITVTNPGQASASNLVIADPINDPNLTLIAGTVTAGVSALVTVGNGGGDSTIQVDYVSFINGSSDTITYDVQIANPVLAGVSTLVNWASADCDELVPEPSNDPTTPTDDDPTVVPLDANPDIAVTKTDGVTEVRPGDTAIYTITVSNIGTQGATGVLLTDSLPAGTTFVSASDGGAHVAGVVTWPAFDLGAGASVQRTVTVTVNDPAALGQSTILNTAMASDDGSNGVDPDLGNNSDTDTDTLIHADLGVSKTDSPDPVLAGETVTYTVSVINNGPATDPNVVVVDTLPAAFTFVSAVPSVGTCNEASGIVTCGLGPMLSSGTATITIVCDVPSDTPVGAYNNSVVVSGDESDPDPSNDSDIEDTTVTTEADLGITKTDLPDPVVAGEVLTWTLDVVNNGPSDASNLVVTDVLPAGVVFVSASAECSESGGTVTCSLSDLINGGTTSFDISVRVDSDVTGTFSNTASVGADQVDPVPANDDDPEDTDVLTSADVWVTKGGPGSVNRGDVLVFDLVIGNNGPSDAIGVVLTDPTPAGLVFVSADAPCAGGFPCALGTIAAGGAMTLSASFTVPVGYAGPDPIVNAASVASDTPDEDPDNNSDDSSTAVDHDAAADMMIVKTGPPSAALGSTVTYHLAVTNNGPNDAANVIVDDSTPAGLIFDSATAPCQAGFPCSLGTVSAGSTVNIDVTFGIPVGYGGTDIVNTATVTTSTTETDTTNNSDDETTPIGDETTDLVIDKQGPTAADPGDAIVYTITVSNLGPGDATGVTVTDTFPGDFTWVSDTCGNDFADGIWSIGALAALDSVTCQITAQVAPTAAGAQTNSVVVTGNEPEGDLTNNDDEVITGIGGEAADVAVVKTGPARAYPGQPLTFTMVVTNNGPGTATSVQLTDPTPAGLVYNSASVPCAGGFPCALGDLGAGSSVTVNVTFDVPANYSGADPIINTATVATTSDDSDPTNDSDDAVTDFVPEADLWVTKDDGVTTVVAGTALVYTITVGNAGPGDVNGGTVTDAFPPQLGAVSWTCAASAGSACTAAGAGDINDIVTVLSGGTLVYTVNATVLPGVTGSIVNTVMVDLPIGMTDPDPSNNTDDDVDVVGQETDLAITKIDSVDPVMEGTQFFYQLDVVNNGPSDATGVVVTDTLPSGLTFVAATSTQGSCSETAGTVTCNLGPIVVGATAQIIVDVELQWGVVGPLSNTATVTGDQVDGDPSNDSDDETTDTLYTELDVLKSVSPPTDGMIYRPGEVVTWTIVTTNSGNTAATVATLVDDIPIGAFYVAESITLDGSYLTDALDGDAGAFDAGANAYAVDLAAIAGNGGMRTVTFNTVLDPPSTNPAVQVVNQAFVDTPGGDVPSDDPTTGTEDDPTVVWVESLGIPTAGPLGLGILVFLIALVGLGILRRRA